jgi:hypothetical protein
MTKAQNALYIRGALAAYRAEKRAESFDEFRHRLVAEALGQPKAFATFTNRDLDRVLAHFKLYIDPDNFDAALDEVNAGQAGHRKRLRYAIGEQIRQLGVRYAWKVAGDKFHLPNAHHNMPHPDWLDQLDNAQLEQLRFTLNARIVSRHKRQLCTTS